MADGVRFFISCEHGGNRVPTRYRPLFHGREGLLATHRGYDIGALRFARRLAAALEAPLETSEVTRLLVDLNRSLRSRTLFSELTRGLGAQEREGILRRHYHPYRRSVAQGVENLMGKGAALIHLSVHSFTPVFGGQVRPVDVGLLYDPARRAEKAYCLALQQSVQEADPSILVRRNYPYRGSSDSVVTALRRRLPQEKYLGIEIEINQKYPQGDPEAWDSLQRSLLRSVESSYPSHLSAGAGRP